jgi:hypothetical protein
MICECDVCKTHPIWLLSILVSPCCCWLHLQGVLKAINVNKLTKCGVTFKFWVSTA